MKRAAMKVSPKVADDLSDEVRLSAACAAVRVASGAPGTPDSATDAEDRSRLVEKALSWLRADLAAWAATLRTPTNSSRALLMSKLNRWKNRTDLAPTRDPQFLRGLSAEQQAAWRSLWVEVDRVILEAVAAGR